MRYIYIFFTLLISSCGSGGTSQISNELSIIDILVNGLDSPSISYQKQSIEIISSNNSCDFEISLEDSEIYKIHHIDTLDYKKYTFRNPIIYKDQESFRLKISTIQSNSCPSLLLAEMFATVHSKAQTNVICCIVEVGLINTL